MLKASHGCWDMLTGESEMTEGAVVRHFGNRLPAKILKRVGQLRRLGPRGIARTAYVTSLGATIYAITDPARQIACRLYRQKCFSHALAERIEHLKQRLASQVAPDKPAGNAPATNFGAERGRFVQSLEAILDLTDAGCAVPRLVGVDWSANAFMLAPVAGKSLRQLDPSSRGQEERLAAIEHALVAVHQAGYVLDHIDEDSIVFDGGKPVITNLEHAIPLAGLSRDMSVYLRDLDRNKLNETFGTRLFTAASLRRSRSPRKAIDSAASAAGMGKVYAPIIVRGDIHWGKIWNTDVGTARWNFIMQEHLPIPRGGSVLDLGSNNGFNPLQMLRLGAASAVGVELEKRAIQQGEFLKSVYEWLDNRSYDFRYIHGSFGDLASFGLPRFDVVTALCSLYYLEEQRMHEVMGTIRSLTDVLVLQCNTDRLIDRSSDDTFRKASVEFALDALERAGFANHKLIAPVGYSRPLIIARAS